MVLRAQASRCGVGAGACGHAGPGVRWGQAVRDPCTDRPARLWSGAFDGAADRLSKADAERRVLELALRGLVHLVRAVPDRVAKPAARAAVLLDLLHRDRAAAHRVSAGARRGLFGNSGG